ncbi:MAG: hypothetical protein ACYC40_04420, partial [Patescibacteria group bacterium]
KIRLSSLNKATSRTNSFWALSFGGTEVYKEFKIGDTVDLVYYLEINDFNGRKEEQLKIVDMKMSKE